MSFAFRLADQQDTDIKALGQVLSEFNTAAVGPSDKQFLAVLANDHTEKLMAGLSGYTAWGWLYIQWLWVDPAFRGQDVASTLLQKAEAEAKTRGCIGAHIDTFNPTALLVYEKSGYEVFGDIPNFVAGRTRSFLQKRWANLP